MIKAKILIVLCITVAGLCLFGCQSETQDVQYNNAQNNSQISQEDALKLDSEIVHIVNNAMLTFANSIEIMVDYGIESDTFYNACSSMSETLITYADQISDLYEENKNFIYIGTAAALVASYSYNTSQSLMVALGDISYAEGQEDVLNEISEYEQILPELRVDYLRSVGLTDEEIEQYLIDVHLLLEDIY